MIGAAPGVAGGAPGVTGGAGGGSISTGSFAFNRARRWSMVVPKLLPGKPDLAF